MKNNIRKIIVIICITIVIVILILIGIKLQESLNKQNEPEETFVAEKKIEKLDSLEEFYNVKTIFHDIQDDINYLNFDPSESKFEFDDIKDVSNNYKLIGIKKIKGILDENYIKEFGITDEKIYNNLVKFANKNLRINNIYISEQSLRIRTYFIYACDIESNEELRIIINKDDTNNTFSIMLEDYFNKNNLSEENIINKTIDMNIEDIKENKYNKYEYCTFSDKDYAIGYFKDYIEIVKNNPERGYEMLDEQYQKKKFENFENFKKFVEKLDFNNNEFEISKYKINKTDSYNEYICIDQYGNYYIFKDKGVMDYTVMLDTYTIDSEEFTNKYNEGSEQLKVGMNLEKVFQALNRKDYTYIYGKLDDNFKQNYFPTIEDFESYMKNTFFEMNKATYGEFEEKTGVYVYNVELSDATQSNQENDENDEETSNENSVIKSFIVKLEDNNDYKLAFNVN